MEKLLNDVATQLVNELKEMTLTPENTELLLNAYNRYIDDETDRENYIYDITKQDDFIALIKLGANIQIIGKIYEKGDKYVVFDYKTNTFNSLSLVKVCDLILSELDNIARCIIAYPYIDDYRKIYTQFITNIIIE